MTIYFMSLVAVSYTYLDVYKRQDLFAGAAARAEAGFAVSLARGDFAGSGCGNAADDAPSHGLLPFSNGLRSE